jgi:hypothetical protein
LRKILAAVNAANSAAEAPKVYRALLTQSGTNAPVATVLENTLGGTLVWSRLNQGVYRGTLTGAFPASKCFIARVLDAGSEVDSSFVIAQRDSSDTVQVRQMIDVDTVDGLTGIPFEILVYP